MRSNGVSTVHHPFFGAVHRPSVVAVPNSHRATTTGSSHSSLAATSAAVAVLLLVGAWSGRGKPSRVRRRDITIEQVAYRMFARNVADYAHPAMVELAWADPDVRAFWVSEAEAVASDLRQRS